MPPLCLIKPAKSLGRDWSKGDYLYQVGLAGCVWAYEDIQRAHVYGHVLKDSMPLMCRDLINMFLSFGSMFTDERD